MTTTTNLDVTLIDSSQNQGGVTANQALNDLDKRASALSIAMSDANLTLTRAQWIYGILIFTGALTANRDVLVPARALPWTIVNSTSGGYSLVVKPSGGTGVTVSSGSTVCVRCDGSTAVKQVTPAVDSTGAGPAFGPGSATDNALARFDGTTGKLIQNSTVTLDDDGNLAGLKSFSVASGTLTDSAPGSTITQTWNDGTEAFVGATMNITDTASLNTSLLQRWQVGGNDVANVGKGATTNGIFGALRATVTTANAVAFAAITTFPATATTSAEGFRSTPTMSDGSGATYAQVVGYRANNPVKSGAGDTITKAVGFQAQSTTVGAANYGFEGLLAVSGTARYNLYMSGTAPNHLAGQLFAGHTASVTTGQANLVQVSGSGSQTGGLGLNRYSADAVGTRLEFAKSRHATIGSNTIVQSGDVLGGIYAYGADGTDYDLAAQILFEVNATPGAGTDMPGRIRDLCSPDGSAAPTEVLRRSAVASAVNYVHLINAATGAGASINAAGSDTDINLPLVPKGTGKVQFGTHSALGAETVTGFITIKDSGGTDRKLAVVS